MMEVQNPSLLIERTVKLLKIISSLPKIERFVSEVCEIVLCRGASFIPYHLQPPALGNAFRNAIRDNINKVEMYRWRFHPFLSTG